MDTATVVTYTLLAVAALGGGAAAYGQVDRWFHSTSFRVTFEGNGTVLRATPDQELTTTILYRNRSHRPVSIDTLSMSGPFQLKILAKSVGTGSMKSFPPPQPQNLDPTRWHVLLVPSPGFTQPKGDSDKVGLQLKMPPYPGRLNLRVVFRPDGEPPFYAMLCIDVRSS